MESIMTIKTKIGEYLWNKQDNNLPICSGVLHDPVIRFGMDIIDVLQNF